jgi:hypothetical protein
MSRGFRCALETRSMNRDFQLYRVEPYSPCQSPAVLAFQGALTPSSEAQSGNKSLRQWAEEIDLIFRAEPRQLFDIWLRRDRQYSFSCRHRHFSHHSYKSVAGHCQNQHGRRHRTADANAMWNPSRQEYITSRSEHSFHSIADKRELAIEHIECFIFDVMKMIRSRVTRRGYLVHHRKRSPGGLGCGLNSTKIVEKPICRSLSCSDTLRQELYRQELLLGPRQPQ